MQRIVLRVHVGVNYEYSRHGMVGGGLGVRSPPPLPFMPAIRSSACLSGCLNAFLFISPFSFRACRGRTRLDFRLEGLRNSSFLLLLDAEGVRSLWALLFLWGLRLLSGCGEFCQL